MKEKKPDFSSNETVQKAAEEFSNAFAELNEIEKNRVREVLSDPEFMITDFLEGGVQQFLYNEAVNPTPGKGLGQFLGDLLNTALSKLDEEANPGRRALHVIAIARTFYKIAVREQLPAERLLRSMTSVSAA